MVLPALPGWLIDYATAQSVFAGTHAPTQIAIIAMCAAGTMKYCACEEK